MKKLIALAAVAILAIVTMSTFASTSGTATITIAQGGQSGSIGTVVAASASAEFLKYADYDANSTTKYVDPSWSPVTNTAGTITTLGDLYHIDTTGYTGDVMVTLYLDNASALARNYSYLNLKANIWKKNNTYVAPTTSAGTNGWEQATLNDSSAIGTVYLTSSNGYVTFHLSGNAEYDVTIDGGSYFCISTDTSGSGSLSPSFYVTLDEA